MRLPACWPLDDRPFVRGAELDMGAAKGMGWAAGAAVGPDEELVGRAGKTAGAARS